MSERSDVLIAVGTQRDSVVKQTLVSGRKVEIGRENKTVFVVHSRSSDNTPGHINNDILSLERLIQKRVPTPSDSRRRSRSWVSSKEKD